MYKKLNKEDGTLDTTQIKRIADGAFIPIDEANTDYQKYLEDVANGATVEEAE